MNRTILAVTGVFSASSLLLVDSAVKGTALLVLAAVTAIVLRRDSAATRHLVWLLAIVAMLAVPVLSAMLPQWRVLPKWARIPPATVVVTTIPPSNTRPADGAIELPQNVESVEIERPSASTYQPAAELPESRPALVTPEAIPPLAVWHWNWRIALPLVWGIGFCVLILRLTAAQWMLWNTERQGTVFGSSSQPEQATDDPLVTALKAVRSQFGIRQPVTLLIHPDKTIPVVWGILRCRLLLPAAARTWSDEQLRSVLLHELAHIKRRDATAQLLTQIACALHWFNPLVWFAAWRLDVERERACDDLVLASGVRPSAYAGHLLEVVTGLSPAHWTQACGLAMARQSSLEGRLAAVLCKDLNRRGVTVAIAGIALALAVGIAVPIAMLRAADKEWVSPQAAHVGGNDFSTYCVHDGKSAAFVIAYRGDFGASTSGSSNSNSRTWHDKATLTLIRTAEKHKFTIRRDHTAPDKLTVARKDYDLKQGRVFLLNADGSVRQFAIEATAITDGEAARKLEQQIAAIPPQARADAAPAGELVFIPRNEKRPFPVLDAGDGVTLAIHEQVFHAADEMTKVRIRYTAADGTVTGHDVFVAEDMLGNLAKWAFLWEHGTKTFWHVNGEFDGKRLQLYRTDFADPRRIVTAYDHNYEGEPLDGLGIPKGVRAKFEQHFGVVNPKPVDKSGGLPEVAGEFLAAARALSADGSVPLVPVTPAGRGRLWKVQFVNAATGETLSSLRAKIISRTADGAVTTYDTRIVSDGTFEKNLGDGQYAWVVIEDEKLTNADGGDRYFGSVPADISAVEKHTNPDAPFIVKVKARAKTAAPGAAPKLPGLPDEDYMTTGIHCQKFREEDAKRPGGELMLEPNWSDLGKEPLELGLRVASDAKWNIGGQARVDLVVRNLSRSDVKFLQTPRADNGLSVVAIDKDGREHQAEIAHFDGLLTLNHLRLPPFHAVMVKAFTLRFDPEKRGVSEPGVAAFHIPPGDYKLRCKWSDARPDVAHEGEWTGELVSVEHKFNLAAAVATPPPYETPPTPAASEPAQKVGAKLPGRIFVNAGLRTTKDETRFSQSAIAIDPNTGSWTRLQEVSKSGFTVPLSPVRVSPDGRTMLFVREKELWKCDAATGDRAERMLEKGSPAAWSPEGKTFIAVVETNERDGQSVENWIVSADGQKQSVLALPKGDAVEDWSADGQWLAVRSRLDSQIYLVKPDGSGRRRLADSVEYSLGHSSFSPDSRRIVYLSRQMLDDKSRFSLRTVNVDGTDDREILGETKAGSEPDSAIWTAPMAARWSPDGKHLAVVLFDHTRDGGILAINGNWRLAMIDADGGNLRELKLEGVLTTVLPWDGPEWRPIAPAVVAR